MTNPKRAWFYGRYSTAGQNETSIERQQSAAEQWCEKYDYELVGSYADRGQSGSIPWDERPAFAELLANPNLQSGDRILIEKLDRISRRGEIERMRIHLYFIDNDLELWLVDSNTNALSENIGDLVTNVVNATTDKTKKDEAVQRSIAGKKLKMQKAIEQGGERVSNNCPAWLVLSEDRRSFEPIPERVEVIKEIFLLAEHLGATRICNELNERGIKSWVTVKKNPDWKGGKTSGLAEGHLDIPKFIPITEDEKVWKPYQVKTLLKDRRLLGELSTVGFGIAENYYPKILDETQLILAKSKLNSRKVKTSPSKGGFKNLFTGILRCAWCNSPIHYSSKGGGYNYMKCSNSCDKSRNYNRSSKDTRKAAMPYETLEKAFLKWAVEIDWSEFVEVKANTKLVKDEIAINDNLIAETNAKIENLTNVLAETGNVHLMAKLNEFTELLEQYNATAETLKTKLQAEIQNEAIINSLDVSKAAKMVADGDMNMRSKLNAQLSDRLDNMLLALGNHPRPYFSTVINGRSQTVFIQDDKSYLLGYDEPVY